MNAELFFFYLYGAGSPLSIFVQNLCFAVLILFSVYRFIRARKAVEKHLVLLLAFLASQVISAFFCADISAGLKGVRDNWALLAGFVAALGLSRIQIGKLSVFQNFLSVSSILAAAMALIQFFFGTDFQRQRLFSSMPAGSNPSKGFFTHHLTFAGFMGMVLLFLLAELFYGKKRPLVIAGATAAFASLLLSQSRGYLIILVLCLPILLYSYSKRYILKACLALCALMAVIFVVSPSHVKARALSLFSMKNGSFAERVYLLKSGIEMFEERPVLGWGPGRYAGSSGAFKARYNDKVIYPGKIGFNTKSHAHNSYLMVLIESGILGLASYLAFLALLLVSMIRSGTRLKWGLLSVFLYFCMGGLFEYNLGDAEVAGLFAFMMGLFVSLKREDAE